MPSADQPASPVVVKVGGSLYDLPGLGPLLRRWLDELASPAVLVPGGGSTADVVRDLDRRHGLNNEAAHWLALYALSLNAHFLAELLRDRSPIVTGEVADWPGLWRRGMLPILDAYTFARADESRPEHLPHCWQATSDSVAARVALTAGARRLVLLKSITIPAGMTWHEAARRGYVDPLFAGILARESIEVRAINLRAWLSAPGSERIPPAPAPAPPP